VHFADWDGDGISDIIVGSEDGGVYWHRNQGKENLPKFGPMQTLIPEMTREEMFKPSEKPVRCGFRVKVHMADYNGDGAMDLLVGDYGTALTRIRTLTPQEAAQKAKLTKEKDKLDLEIKPLRKKGSKSKNSKNSKATPNVDPQKQFKELKSRIKTLTKELKKFKEFAQSDHGSVWVYLRKKPSTTAAELNKAASGLLAKTLDSEGELVEMAGETERDTVKPGGVISVKINLNIEKGWHIYSSEKGDGYLPTQLSWDLPKGVSLVKTTWPDTESIKSFGQTKPGYHGMASVMAQLQVSKELAHGVKLPIKVSGSWQVCKDICKRGHGKTHIVVTTE
jgi:hypothetical protein